MKPAKRTICLLLALVTVCSIIVPAVSAASITPYDALTSSRYAKVFTLATSGRQTVYTQSDLKTPGNNTGACNAWIDCAADELWIMDVGVTNGQYWAHISYPVSSGRRTGFIPLSALTANSHAVKSTSSGKFYCSPRLGKAVSSSYYVAASDVVWLVAVNGSQVQLLYPASSGYRLAWASKSDYEKYCGKISGGSGQLIPDGDYIIVSGLNGNKVVDVNGASNDNCANVQLWTRNGSGAQIFRLTYNPGGWYTIINVQSGKALDVSNGTAKCGQNVWQYEVNGTNAQKWYLEDAGNGCYYIRSALGYYLDVNGGNTADGTNIQIWTGKTSAQIFKFEATFSPIWPCQNARYISTMYRYWNSGNVKNHGCKSNMYNGFDISGSSGDTIYAIESGTVVDKGYSSGSFGNYVIIQHANGLRSLYAHMKYASCVNKGDTVSRGQTIGYMGTTGNSTGNHLHFEVYNPNNHSQVINPWATWYQGKISVTIGSNSYRANSKYPSDAAAAAWCSWLTTRCTKNSAGHYVFTA
ncbi:MAG: RICIN domain-containing protein [Oscillospiraceae bacterium]|nr:RICIN domain-containing protein [Oscillospiraceae bacterium]